MGDRYGFRPIPTEINEEEFEALKEASERITIKPHAVKLLETWYKLDENCLPPKYILQVSLKTSHILSLGHFQLNLTQVEYWFNCINDYAASFSIVRKYRISKGKMHSRFFENL